jgi:glyoxylase-like metal-dependent hydrolase (beta-lactamase superfamily II)
MRSEKDHLTAGEPVMKTSPQAYAPGLYGLVGQAVNIYIIDDAQSGVTIIDTGIPGSTHRILQLVSDIGRTLQDIRHILITHADIDHVGNLSPLMKATGATVYASELSSSYIQRRQSPPHLSFPMVIPVGILNRLFRRAVPIDHIIKNDERLDIAGGIRALVTPGHTPDHVCYFWERESVLFAGDLLGNKRQLAVSPQSPGNFAQAQKSARLVLALNPAVICPGHGRIVNASHDSDQITALQTELSAGK